MTQVSLTPPGRLKAYDPAQDADAVIKLIEESFNLKTDPESMNIINQMRLAAQRQTQPGLNASVYRQPGYVWVMDDQIVGNINIVSFLDKLRHIALIANVAVKPEFQHLGIATALAKHALRYAQQKRASEVWLQVSSENQAAQNLYAGLGFQVIRKVNNWVLEQAQPKIRSLTSCDSAKFTLTRRRIGDWSKQKFWLEAAYPMDTRWYASVNFNQFRPLAWLNPFSWDWVGNLTHFALRKEQKLAGLLSWQTGMQNADYLWLAIPENPDEDNVLTCLVRNFLDNEWGGRTTRLEYPEGRMEIALERLGFHLNRRLNWMKFKR
jgi:ribosomal protein S18 acetylase RimI-like enzyme